MSNTPATVLPHGASTGDPTEKPPAPGGISLESVAPYTFVARGGPCDGARFVVRRSTAGERKRGSFGQYEELKKDGLREAGGGNANVIDLEDDLLYEVRTDGAPGISHHDGHDARHSLEEYLATEAVARVIEGANRMPMIGAGAYSTLRTVRPDLQPPAPRVPIFGLGEWTDDVANAWVLQVDHGKRVSALAIENLRLALKHASPADVRELCVSKHRRELDGRTFRHYAWYGKLPKVTSIKPDRRGLETAKSRGVHVLPRLRIEVRAEGKKAPRRVDAPMWLADPFTLLVREGFEPTVPLLTEMMHKGTHEHHGNTVERWATELLGQAGERAMHEELERKFTDYVASQIGDELEVTVSIKPKAASE